MPLDANIQTSWASFFGSILKLAFSGKQRRVCPAFLVLVFLLLAESQAQEMMKIITNEGGAFFGTPVGMGYSSELKQRAYYIVLDGDTDPTPFSVTAFPPDQEEKIYASIKRSAGESKRRGMAWIFERDADRRRAEAAERQQAEAQQYAEKTVYQQGMHPVRLAEGLGQVKVIFLDLNKIEEVNSMAFGKFRDSLLSVRDEDWYFYERAYDDACAFRDSYPFSPNQAAQALLRMRWMPEQQRAAFRAIMNGPFAQQVILEKTRGAGWDKIFQFSTLELVYLQALADLP